MAEIREIRCINCDRKLGENTMPDNLMVASTASVHQALNVKCDRCGIINAVYNPLTKGGM